MDVLHDLIVLNAGKYIGVASLYIEGKKPEVMALLPFPLYESYRILRGDCNLTERLNSVVYKINSVLQKSSIDTPSSQKLKF